MVQYELRTNKRCAISGSCASNDGVQRSRIYGYILYALWGDDRDSFGSCNDVLGWRTSNTSEVLCRDATSARRTESEHQQADTRLLSDAELGRSQREDNTDGERPRVYDGYFLPDNLRKYRRKKRLTQAEFGALVGVTRNSVSSYEDSRAQPTLETTRKIARLIGVTMEQLIWTEL